MLGRSGSRRLALIMLLLSTVLLGGLQLAVGLELPENLLGVVLFTLVFWIWIGAGVVAWWRRPDNATGALIVLGGLAVFVGGLGNLPIESLVGLSAIFATSILAVTVHLLHAFPSGRLRGRLSVATVVVGYVVSIGLQAARYTFAVTGQSEAFSVTATVQEWLGLSVMAVTAVILVGRLRQAEPEHRRILLPLFLYGSLAVLAIPLAAVVLPSFGVSGSFVGVVQLTLSAGLPIAFLLGVLLGGFTRTGELEALSAWLGASGAGRQSVATALASTLGDPSLRVMYWASEDGANERSRYVDEVGAPVEVAAWGEHRRLLEVRVEERLVGAIVYDERMIGDPDTVQRVGQVLAIAIDRERLTAELVASNDALLRSRQRLVETADRERTRIAQDLHDGLQVQLVLLALEAQQIGTAAAASTATSRAATELRERIDGAAADLRRLVHNVLPAALVERGLSAATEDLVDRLEIPATLEVDVSDSLSPAVTYTAYVIVAEGLANAVKHSGASLVEVTLRQSTDSLVIGIADNGVGGARTEDGTGLRGLVDRVDVLGGTFSLHSSPDNGTELKVELPCVS